MKSTRTPTTVNSTKTPAMTVAVAPVSATAPTTTTTTKEHDHGSSFPTFPSQLPQTHCPNSTTTWSPCSHRCVFFVIGGRSSPGAGSPFNGSKALAPDFFKFIGESVEFRVPGFGFRVQGTVSQWRRAFLINSGSSSAGSSCTAP